ncbi:hypothetical protein [Lactobacillus hominis]|uniref:Uncharacterized protein n=1 Tax=Lactobacillus hominis DSM 23910 = CRBIP 24.179 TaxID=1423758 RepID=I7JU39_9LACO|nr:hypothetical protein [Lactobacillus hominis]MCT3348680.1 hypothetical protein [Lactobacillus hominis]CCI80946.1 Putative uncharacterized protein [Lactobacillus hominis DSM 23910 = CRBIP 24.179]
MHLSKLFSWILRMILIICIFITMGTTLSSAVTLKVNAPNLVKHVINKTVQESNNSNVQNGLALVQALGVEDALLEKLPKNIKLQTSMYHFYQFTDSYQKEGKLTAENLKLPNKNDQQKTVNDLVLKFANSKLDENKNEIAQGISYYKIFFYGVLVLYLLAILFVLLNKRIAFIPLLLASIGSYATIGYLASQLNTSLQTTIYSGIRISLDSGFSMSIILSIIISVIWFATAGLGKDHMLKKGKHAA